MKQDLFSEIRAPPAAASFPSYPMGGYASGPQQYLNPSYPGAATPYAPNGFPGQRPELPSGLPGAAAAGSAAFPAFSGMQQYTPQAGGSAVPQGSAPVFPMANGALVPPVPPQPAGKLASSEGPPDPFSMLVPGLKAALPTATTAPPPQGFSSFAPGSAPGLGSGFGSLTHAQIPTNGQIPALHATAHVGFGAPSGASAPGAKSGNPFA
jgi:collagen type IV alpha